MGLVLLCNLVASIEREDIVPNFEAVRRESVHAIFSTISLGLNCRVAFNKDGAQRNKKLASLISLDPYPHHILASISLAADILLVYLKRDEIAHDAFESSCRIVFDTLDELPQCLRSVQKVKRLLYHKLVESTDSLGNGSRMVRSPSADLPIPLRQRHEHVMDNERDESDRDNISDSSRYSIADPTNGSSLSSLNSSNIEAAGLNCLTETLFSGPAVVLSTIVS